MRLNKKKKIEGKTPKSWLALAKKRYNQDKAAREQLDYKVFLWRQFRDGNQWLMVDSTTNKLVNKGGFDKINQIIPETDRLIDLVANILTSGDVTFWYVPRKTDDEERAHEISQKCNDTREYLDDELDLDYKKRDSARESLTDGVAYVYVGYDHSKYYLDSKGEKVYDGMPTCEIRNWFDVYIDNAATSIEEARWATFDLPRDVEYLKQKYGVEVKSDDKLSGSDYGQYDKQMRGGKKEAQKETVILHETWLKHLYADKLELEFDGEKVERTIVKHKWVVVKWVDGLEYPIDVVVDPLKDNELPVVKIAPRAKSRSIEGRSLVKALSPLNRQANEIYSTMLKVLKRFGAMKIVVDKGSGIRKGDITSESMEILEKNRGTEVPGFVKVPPLPEMYSSMLDRILKMMADYSNAHEALAGGVPPGVTAGKALITLIEQDQAANSTRKENFIGGWAKVYYKLLRRVADFWSVDHQLAIRGEDGQVKNVDIKPQDVDVVAVKAEVTPSLAYTFNAKVEQAKELYQLGLLSREKMMRILKLGNISELLEQQEEDARKGLLPQAGGIGGLNPKRMAEGIGAEPPQELPQEAPPEPSFMQAL